MLGVVVLVVAIAALRHPTSKSTSADTSSHAPSPSRSSTSRSTAPSTHPTSSVSSSSASGPKALPLVVLNNTTTPHLASDAATLFEQAGWKVTSYGNYSNNIASTCAYYDPSVPGAEQAASLLQTEFPAIMRVKPKFSGLVAGPIVVVLTPGFTTA